VYNQNTVCIEKDQARNHLMLNFIEYKAKTDLKISWSFLMHTVLLLDNKLMNECMYVQQHKSEKCCQIKTLNQ